MANSEQANPTKQDSAALHAATVSALTPDISQENIAKLTALFPNIATEVQDPETGAVKQTIDFEALKALLGDVAEGTRERYQFTWPGKRGGRELALTPTDKTLHPEVERSKDWDTTQNLYIEGDNLEALKILRSTYAGKVKLIYIDPPYNTGHDFVYKDDFAADADAYKAASGDYSADGAQLVANPESNGRFHSDWCSMIYPRLLLARDFLTQDGAIFISIDDNEQANLKKICDEIFGPANFIAQFVWQRAYSPKNDARFVSNSHDYVLMYCRDISQFTIGRLPRTEEANARYQNPDNDPRGPWKPSDLSVKTYNEKDDYPITTPSGRVVEPPTGRCWSLSAKAFAERLQDGRIWFGPNGDSAPALKRFLSELKYDGMAPQSILPYKEVGHSQEGAQETAKLMGGGYFDGPKPVKLLQRIICLGNAKGDDIVMDFFSGSATTAHAVMKANAKDGGNRKFILVQLPEATDEKSEAYKAGYHTICEMGEERIRRAGEQIKAEIDQENAQITLDGEQRRVPDVGFRVLSVGDSNWKNAHLAPGDYKQGELFDMVDTAKPGRSPLDRLFECLPVFQIEPSASITQLTDPAFEGHTVYSVDDGHLIACLDSSPISEELVNAIADLQPAPVYAVFSQDEIPDSATLTNVTEIMRQRTNDFTRTRIF